MWIEDLPNGKYKYVERYDNPLTGKTHKVSMTHDKKTKKVQEQMLLLLQEKIKLKLVPLSSKETFESISNAWVEMFQESVKPSTASRAKTHLRSLNKEIGDRLFKNLTASDFNGYFLSGLQSGRFKYNTIIQTASIVKRIIKFAVRYKGINRMDIIPLLDVPKINLTESDDFNFLERDELKKILVYFNDRNMHEFKRMVLLQVNTGMRYAEMVSLDYERDIDFDSQSITVTRNYDFDNKVFTTPKTGKARTIYFSSDIGNVLKEQIIHDKKKMIYQNISKDNKLLFKTKYGNPISTLTYNNALKKVGITHKVVTSHIFRHTFVSMAVEKGISRELIAEQVGHTDISMINKVYAHFTKTMQSKQKEAMSDFKII